MPVRHLNFTNRIKLTRDQANVQIYPGSPASFDALLKLPKLPATAKVFVEAEHGTTRMRFDFGTVGNLVTPASADRLLTEFDDWRHVQFRVKVTDVTDASGKILAWANGIKPKGPDDDAQDDFVRWKDVELDGLLWDIYFEDGANGGPVVLVDKSVTVHKAKEDGRFLATVYPEILRRTLNKAILLDDAAPDDEEHWFHRWYKGYLVDRLGMQPLPLGRDETLERREWIDTAVHAFGRTYRVINDWHRMAKAEGGK